MKLIFVIFMVIKIYACLKVHKTPKHSTKICNNDAWSLTFKSDKQSFPKVIYPTSILDVTEPFYFNKDDNFKVTDPFSKNVKSSNDLLASFAKLTDVCKTNQTKTQYTANDIALNVLQTDTYTEGETDDYSDDDKENATIILIEKNKCNNHTDLNLSCEDIKNVTEVPIYVKIKMEVFKDHANVKKDNTKSIGSSSQELDEKAPDVNRFQESYESSKEIENNSKENYTETEYINKSDNGVSLICSIDFSENRDNMSEVWNTTSDEIVLEEIDSFEKCNISESLNDDVESSLESPFANITQTDLIDNYDQSADSKEGCFLDFLISLDSLCENDNIEANATDVKRNFYIEQGNQCVQ